MQHTCLQVNLKGIFICAYRGSSGTLVPPLLRKSLWEAVKNKPQRLAQPKIPKIHLGRFTAHPRKYFPKLGKKKQSR